MAEDFESNQQELSQLWKKARQDGCMPPWQQAKVFGLKEAWEEMHGDKTYGQATWIAERVYVQGTPKKHPSDTAVRKLLKKMEDDEDGTENLEKSDISKMWPFWKILSEVPHPPTKLSFRNHKTMTQQIKTLRESYPNHIYGYMPHKLEFARF